MSRQLTFLIFDSYLWLCLRACACACACACVSVICLQYQRYVSIGKVNTKSLERSLFWFHFDKMQWHIRNFLYSFKSKVITFEGLILIVACVTIKLNLTLGGKFFHIVVILFLILFFISCSYSSVVLITVCLAFYRLVHLCS